MFPIAGVGRILEKNRKNPLPLVILLSLPVFLYCFSNRYMFMGAREAAQRSDCRNHMKQLGLLFETYHEELGHFPPAVSMKEGEHPVSWRVEFADRMNALNGKYDRTLSWDAPANLPLLKKKPAYYKCPTHQGQSIHPDAGHTSYALVTGSKTIFPESGPLSRER
ncbi:MAG: DUF1559 domain-containing protein [Planctomycetaceae bacterium]